MFSAIELPKINTGTDLVVSSSNMMTTTGGAIADVQPMSPMDSLRAVFDDMRYALESIAVNTLETNNLLQRLAPTSAENRDDKINDGETDTQGNENPPDKGGSGFLDKLKGLNPFKDGLGTFGKFAIALGALVGLKLFGDKLIPGIAKLLESIKTGKIGETLEDIYISFKEGAIDVFNDIKYYTEQFLIAARTVMNIIKAAYNMVNDYIMQFDKTGGGPAGMSPDGKLDEAEFANLKEDLKQKAVEVIGDFFKDVVKSVAGLLLGATLINITAKAAYARLLPIFASTSTTAAAAATGAAGAGAAASVLPIAGLLLYGVTQTWSNISNSMKDTIDEEGGKFTFSGFFEKFFGGDKGGGIMNALRKGFEVGGTFALAGVAIGAAIGAPLGGIGAIPGALAGGLIGTGIGFLVGAFTGWLGSDKLKAFGDGFMQMIDDAVASIKQFFFDIVDSVKSFFTGSPTKKAADEFRLKDELTELETDLAEAETVLAKNPDYAPFVRKVENIKKDIEEKKQELANVPLAKAELEAGVTLGMVSKQIEDKQFEIDAAKFTLDKAERGDGIFMPKSDQDILRNRIIMMEQEKIELEDIKTKLDSVQTSSAVIVPEKITDKVKTTVTTNENSPGHPSNQVMANVGNTYQSNVKGGDSFVTGGLSTDNTHFTALIMANKNAKMQT